MCDGAPMDGRNRRLTLPYRRQHGEYRMRHATVAFLLLAAHPVLAQDRPTIMPTRDVSVVYRVTGEGAPSELTMSWLTAQSLMRMDMPGGMGFIVVNPQAGSGFMAMAQMRMIMDLPPGTGGVNNFARASQTARFTREGSDRVANIACTNWRIDDRGETGRACLTADGVTLRANSGGGQTGRGAMEAMQVTYAPQDAARFARPQGYQAMQVPGGAGASPGTPPGGPPPTGGSFPQRGSALPPPGVAR